MSKQITITGAGLVGSLLSILLQKRGYKVTILERRPDMRKATMYAGKSINLAMSVRGWAALEMAGLRSEIEEIAIPMYGRQIHHTDNTQVYQQYGKNNEAIYSVSRGDLNRKLMTLAEKCGVEIRFNQRVDEVELSGNRIQGIDTETNISFSKEDHEILIAADGAFSALRNAYMRKDRFNYQQFYIEHGYKELFIPAGADQSFQIEKNALHIWPRKNYMMIALPNFDGSFTCTLFFPFEGNPSFDTISSEEKLLDFFHSEFPDAVPLMPSLVEDYFTNPTSSLVTVKCSPWIHEDKNMLIGDAAHAIVPFYGQGMNAGLEDCRIFTEILDASKDASWGQIFSQYQEARKKNGDAVADLALQNFIEMRDLVADPVFLERKKIEKQLGVLFPNSFNSVYEMVSFSHTPYHVAISSQKAQDKLLERIMKKGNFDENLQDSQFKDQLGQWIKEYEADIALL
jgi:kynurenine 3-monooxygenase